MKLSIFICALLWGHLLFSQQKKEEKQISIERKANTITPKNEFLKQQNIYKKTDFKSYKIQSIQKIREDQERLQRLLQFQQKQKQKQDKPEFLIKSISEADQEKLDAIIEAPDKERDSIYNSPKEIFSDDPKELKASYNRLRGPSTYDSRIEIYQLNPEINWQYFMLLANQSVAMVIEKESIVKISDSHYKIETESNKSKHVLRLCNNLPFSNQPVVGVGTAFLINNNQFITAKHVFQQSIENYVIVFGIDQLNPEVTQSYISKEQVFFPTKISHNLSDIDIVIFDVDRETNRSGLSYGNSRTLEKQHEIYSIGHPSGLPKKIALNAGILDNSYFQYFYTSLDTFQGNSGSPVLDFYTNTVIGVLVAGEKDFKFNGNCYELNTCKFPKCKGEKVIRIEEIINRL